MKINAKPKEHTLLSEVKQGDTFFYDERFFIRTDEKSPNGVGVACVNLNTGVVCYFSQNQRVSPVELAVVNVKDAEK